MMDARPSDGAVRGARQPAGDLPEKLLQSEHGRIRDVATGPDGYLYLLTDASDGELYRLEPVE